MLKELKRPLSAFEDLAVGWSRVIWGTRAGAGCYPDYVVVDLQTGE